MRHIAFLMAMAMACIAAAQVEHAAVRVEGVVINSADGNPLPLCFVTLQQDGQGKARAVTDYAGRYMMPAVAAGEYTLEVVQFGDTLMHYKGLTIRRDTRVSSVVRPPAATDSTALPQYEEGLDGATRLLRPVMIYTQRNRLAKMGYLITSADDPRLFDFSEKRKGDFMLPDRSKWYSKYKTFFKLRSMGYNITSPYELRYPEVYHPASDSTKSDGSIWVLGIRF